MRRNRKSGFTLVELMVVAIIVAILAAVAIPLMSANKDRAMATEAQAGIGAIVTAAKVYYTEEGSVPGSVADMMPKYLKNGDLVGKYFDDSSYSISTGLTWDDNDGLEGAFQADSILDNTKTVTLTLPGNWNYSWE